MSLLVLPPRETSYSGGTLNCERTSTSMRRSTEALGGWGLWAWQPKMAMAATAPVRRSRVRNKQAAFHCGETYPPLSQGAQGLANWRRYQRRSGQLYYRRAGTGVTRLASAAWPFLSRSTGNG